MAYRDRIAEDLARINRGQFSETNRMILDEIRSAPNGLTRAELAERTNRTLPAIEGATTVLQKAGFITSTRTGSKSRWVTPERVNRVTEMILEERLQRQKMLRREKQAEATRARLAAERGDGEEDDMPVIRIVPACSVPPPSGLGPNSVFNIAA